jgi:hypothetical protein
MDPERKEWLKNFGKNAGAMLIVMFFASILGLIILKIVDLK